MYAGKTLAEIAGYTPWVRVALFMPRDKHGVLKRSKGLPEGVEVDERGFRVVGEGSSRRTTMEQAVKRSWRKQGMSKQAVEETWQRYREANPEMGRGGRREGKGAKGRQQNPPGKVHYVQESD